MTLPNGTDPIVSLANGSLSLPQRPNVTVEKYADGSILYQSASGTSLLLPSTSRFNYSYNASQVPNFTAISLQLGL